MRKPIFKRIVLGAMIAAAIPACTNLNLDDINSAEFGTSLAVPIGSISVGIEELLSQMDSAFLHTDEATGEIAIIWNGDDIQQEISLGDYSPEPVKMNDTIDLKEHEPFKSAFEDAPAEQDRGINVPVDEPESFSSDIQIDYSYDDFIGDEAVDFEIDSLMMASGSCDIDVTINGVSINDYNPMTVHITLPYVTDNGTNVVEHTLVKPHETIHFDMKDFIVKFEDGKVAVPIDLLFTVESYDKSLYANRNASVKLETDLHIADCRKIWGFADDNEPLASDHIDFEMPELSFLTSESGNDLKFADPSMTITVESDLDMPLILEIASMYAQNANGEKVNASFDGKESLRETIGRPEAEGSLSHQEIVFDNENGRLGDMLAINPQRMYARYSVSAGDDGMRHIIALPSNLTIGMEAKIPLYFDAGTSFSITDTTDIDMSGTTDGIDYVDIQEVVLYLDITSMMPIALDATAHFIDGNGNITYSTPEGSIKIPSAVVGNDGASETATQQRLKLEFTGENITKVLDAKSIAFEITVSGMDENAKIKLRTTDSLSIKISAFAKAGVTFDIENL